MLAHNVAVHGMFLPGMHVCHVRPANLLMWVDMSGCMAYTAGVVWAMKFSHSGRFLATAGQDGIVYVWEVASNRGLSPSAAEAAAPSDPSSNGHKEGPD